MKFQMKSQANSLQGDKEDQIDNGHCACEKKFRNYSSFLYFYRLFSNQALFLLFSAKTGILLTSFIMLTKTQVGSKEQKQAIWVTKKQSEKLCSRPKKNQMNVVHTLLNANCLIYKWAEFSRVYMQSPLQNSLHRRKKDNMKLVGFYSIGTIRND